jgi:hypothetical protein
MWLLLAAAASASAAASEPLHYKSVTETEYAIELVLESKGQAHFTFDSWEADDSAPASREELAGTWAQQGSRITVNLVSGANVTYQLVQCLPYQEFGQTGCSPGLKLVNSGLSAHYGLQRFGLWDARFLRVGP